MQLPKELITVTPFSKYLAMVLFVLFPIFGFYFGIQYQKSLNTSSQQKQGVCTQEVKLCPDGSYVSRQGSDCSFALCPEQKTTPQTPSQYAITPTIIPTSQSGWSTYVDSNNLYSFNFPSTWKVDAQGNSAEPTKPWVRMYYMENNKQYTFELGQGGSGVAGTDNISETQVTYAGQSFDQKTFLHAGSPFLISIVPNNTQTEQKYFNHIGIELPPTNTDLYIQNFKQILSSFKFTDQMQVRNTQNWQLYTSVGGKITFKYPSNALLHINQVHEFETNQYQPSPNTIEIDTSDAQATPFILIQYDKQQNLANLTDFIGTQKYCADITPIRGATLTVGGMKAKFFQTKCGPAGYDVVFVQKANMFYTITINGDYDSNFFNTFLANITFL